MGKASASFVLMDPDGQLCGILPVHVDDGAWGGKGRFFDKARQYVRDRLSLRHENSGTLKMLGRTIIHRPKISGIKVN